MHPFQCIAAVQRDLRDSSHLLAACGSQLLLSNLSTGEVISTWPPQDNAASGLDQTDGGGDERLSKKRKTTPATTLQPKIIKVAISPDHHHAAVVTEDKAVHVIEMSADGTLTEMSARTMPKRPCAIQILPDNATILCGDKFGDVYSLPLLPTSTDMGAAADPEMPQAEFKPSATDKTVHTKRNLRALEAQKKQKNLTSSKRKEPLQFEHKLLLGHVSMLTDMTYATHQVEGRERRYIITADRDEHIRISRDQPQSHIIEGYCLGHHEFVSRICPIPGTDLLVSGGGDEWIGVWRWPEFKLKWKIDDFGKHVREVQGSRAGDKPGQGRASIAVSGIWIVPATGGTRESAVVVACEKSPVLAICPVSELTKDENFGQPQWRYEALGAAPVVDVSPCNTGLIVAFDDREASSKRLATYRVDVTPNSTGASIKLEEDHNAGPAMKPVEQAAGAEENMEGLDDFLYGIEKLRKRKGWSEGKEEAEDLQDEGD